MNALPLTLPARDLEAWRYVTPSLLKELSQFNAKSPSTPITTEHRGLVLHSGKMLSHRQPQWREAITIKTFCELSPKELKLTHAIAHDEHDCFARHVLSTHSDNGLFLQMPQQAPAKEPLEIVILGQGSKTLLSNRLHISLPKLSQHHINLHFVGMNAEDYANLCELSFDHNAGSALTLCVFINESPESMTLTGFQHTLKRDSRLSLQILNGENKLTRHHIQVDLDEENAEVDLTGIGSLTQSGTLHHHLKIRHQSPNCRSKQLFKTVLAGTSRSSFDGTIEVARDAIKTEARQLSRYLLLSPKTRANAKPQLKIYADDVVCTHGSTIGQLEEDELFYLQTRGLQRKQAEHLLSRGFIEEVLMRYPDQHYANLWRKQQLDRQFPNIQ